MFRGSWGLQEAGLGKICTVCGADRKLLGRVTREFAMLDNDGIWDADIIVMLLEALGYVMSAEDWALFKSEVAADHPQVY